MSYYRKLVFGRGGRLAYQQKMCAAVTQSFDAIHDQHTITLRQQAAGAGANP